MKTMKTENAETSIVEFVPFGTKDKISLSIEIVKRLIAVKTKSGKTASDEDAFKFMLMCQARKLNPFEGDAYLIGYDGQHGASFSLITAHQAFLKRAELHPEFDGMDSGTIVLRDGKITDLVGDWHMPNDKVVGGWATVYFKGRAHPMKKRVRLERFNKNYGVWRDDPAGMIVKCAEADALRSSFPTMLGGMFISEELEPAQTAEIARPVFTENATTTNGDKMLTKCAEADVLERSSEQPPERVAPMVPAAEETKKKPTLQRRSAARSTEKKAVEPAGKTAAHERLTELLARGNCTPDEFMQLALSEGWVGLEQGTFEKIPEERITEFLKDENWAFITTLLDERAMKRNADAAELGNLL
jgi:phage recombination protein Bet